MTLPKFRYHPDPIASGSIVSSTDPCRRCGEARGYAYAGPVYAEAELENQLCPWCIADGSAHREFDAQFVDAETFGEAIPAAVIGEVTTRTPGYNGWQQEQWPTCCGDATAFIGPFGLEELRKRDYQLEGLLLPHIVHTMEISGGAATRLLNSLNLERGPTVYLFRCLKCEAARFHIDGP